MSFFDLSHKTAVVTGASGGIGAVLAEALAEAGCRLALMGRHEQRLAAAVTACTRHGVSATAVRCDLREAGARATAIEAARTRLGGLDILVNAAGVLPNPRKQSSQEVWEQVWQTNVLAPVHLCELVAPLMRARGGGKIINVTSIADSFVPTRHMEAYGSSKAALRHYSRCLAVTLGPDNIQVNVLSPGYFATSMSDALPKSTIDNILLHAPLQRAGALDELGGVAVMLAGRASDFVTGAVITVDGGVSLRTFPRVRDYEKAASARGPAAAGVEMAR